MAEIENAPIEAVELHAINRYPVKSLPGEWLSRVDVQKGRGLPGDREWALATGTLPIAQNGDWTACSAFERLTTRPGMAAWSARIGADGQPELFGPDCGLKFDAAGQVVGNVPAPFAKTISLQRASAGYWDHADSKISIINLTTVEAIESAIAMPVDPARFRGNLLIRAAAWSEFGWLGRTLDFEDLKLRIIRPIDRCRATSVKPGSGEIDVNMPAHLLRHFGHIYCGVYATVSQGGTLRSGMTGKLGAHTAPVAVKNAAQQPTAASIVDWPRPLTVEQIIAETENVRSVWLRDPLAELETFKGYRAAQHIRLHALEGRSVWRVYTISGVKENCLRITVKRDRGPGSNAVHRLQVGATVFASGPAGRLQLPGGYEPVTLLTAGIGITPAVAILRELAKTGAQRSIELVHLAQTEDTAALWKEAKAAVAMLPNATAALWTSQSAGNKREKKLFDFRALATSVSQKQASVVMCGPPGFMEAASQAFSAAGIPKTSMISEAFASPDVPTKMAEPSHTGPFDVHFSRSGVTATWTKADGTLLDLAEANGILVPSHCRAGLCGTCAAPVTLGTAQRLTATVGDQDSVLTCCSVPTQPMEIDL